MSVVVHDQWGDEVTVDDPVGIMADATVRVTFARTALGTRAGDTDDPIPMVLGEDARRELARAIWPGIDSEAEH